MVLKEREYKQRERRLVSEYIMQHYPRNIVMYNFALGPPPEPIAKALPEEKALRVSRPWRPRVDAVVITEDKMILVEADIMNPRDGLGYLPMYKSLVPQTPELKRFLDKPVEMLLVLPWKAPWIEEAARAAGIQVAVFRPAWIDKYVEEFHKYWTKEYRLERIRRKYGERRA